jgi:hypothetical protein
VQETANENNASNHKRRIFHYLCIDNIFITDIHYLSFQLYDDLRAELTRDPTLCSLCDEVCTGVRGDEWKLTDGIITMVGRIYIPLSSSCLPAVLVRRDFFLPGAIVRDHVHACVVCQQNKVEQLSPRRPAATA